MANTIKGIPDNFPEGIMVKAKSIVGSKITFDENDNMIIEGGTIVIDAKSWHDAITMSVK